MCFRKCSEILRMIMYPLMTQHQAPNVCCLIVESQLRVWCWARSLVERWKLRIKSDVHGPACRSFKPSWEMRDNYWSGPKVHSGFSIWCYKKPKWPFWSTQCKEITLSRVWIHRIWKGTVSTVRFDFFLHVSNHRTQCFLARLEIGCQGNPTKQKISPGGRGWGWGLTEEMGGRN